MRKLEVGSIPLPRIYVCENEREARECRMRGIPHFIWRGEYELLVKLVLFPTLAKMFPHIDWEMSLGFKRRELEQIKDLKVHVADNDAGDPTDIRKVSHVADGDEVDEWLEREYDYIDEHGIEGCDAKMDNDPKEWAGVSDSYHEIDNEADTDTIRFSSTSLHDAVGDLSGMVDIKELQKLNLMPKWLGDIADVVTKNIEDLMWQEGYNKKLRYPAGNFNNSSDLPNLLILDVSASIPPGIAATMLSLLETLREQANADVIVTARTSGWYPKDKPLPSPEYLRKVHPRGQESDMFNAILEKHVFGKEWGNVICFGDNDSPSSFTSGMAGGDRNLPEFKNPSARSNTSVKHIWSYHTMRYVYDKKPLAGYCRWCLTVSPDAVVTHNNSWANMMR